MSDTDNPLGYAEGWRPDPGDVIVGTVKEMSVGYSQWGSYPIIVIEQEDDKGEVAVHGFHTALYNRLRQLKPRLGERIGIQYQGKRVSKSNPQQSVQVYVVRIHGRDGSDVWETLDAENAPAPVPQPSPQERLPMSPAETQDTRDTDDIPF